MKKANHTRSSLSLSSALRAVPVSDHTHERAWNKRGGDRDNERHHSARGDGDAAARRYVSRPNRKFQSELTGSFV